MSATGNDALSVRRASLVVVVLCAAALCGSGCAVLLVGAAAGAGVAGTAYVLGDLEAQLEADPPAVAKATDRALDALQIRRISNSSSGLDAVIVGRTGADKKVTVKVKGAGEGRSKISIRVGAFGDESMSREILRRIEKEL
jgi:hypothetical protein